MSANMSRRTLLRSIAVGGAAIAAPSLLTGCSTESSGGSVSNVGKKSVAWPTYKAATGAVPDLAATAEGVQAGYTAYPSELVQAVAEKPGTGKEKIRVLTITYGTPPKPLATNTTSSLRATPYTSAYGMSTRPASEYGMPLPVP